MSSSASASWPWYVSGPLLALLVILSLYVFNDPIGMGDAMTVVSEYCVESVENGRLEVPPMDWQLGLLIGILVGALGAAALAGDLKPRFSEGEGGNAVSMGRMVLCSLAGGFLVMTGMQLGGDSFLGQFSAAMQLSGAAWVFLIALAVSGCMLAVLLDRRSGGSGGGTAVGKKARPAAKKSKGKA